MKNLQLLAPDLQEKILGFTWGCLCGQRGLRVSVTRKGTIQGHCFSCGQTFFWNDVGLFYMDNPFCFIEETPQARKQMKNKGYTTWYPNHRVRQFTPPGWQAAR